MKIAKRKKATTAVKPKRATVPAKATKRKTKGDAVIEMLRKPGGATLDAIAKSTGWQPHSIRGFVSCTLKKRLGLVVVSAKQEGGERTYSIAK
jgi:Protein of unknown function (DUF3489)